MFVGRDTSHASEGNKPPVLENQPAVYQPDWSPWARQVVTVGLIIAAVFGLTLLTPIITLLIITFLLTFLLFIPARALAKRTRLTYNGAVLVIFAVVVVSLIAFIVLAVPGVARAIQNTSGGLIRTYGAFEQNLRDWDPEIGPYRVRLPGDVELDITQYILPVREAILESDAEDAAAAVPQTVLGSLPEINAGAILAAAASAVAGALGSVASFFSTLFLGLFISLIILLELPRYQHSMLRDTPIAYQREMRVMVHRVVYVWQGFFRGQLVLCVLIGVLTFIQLVVMGVPGAGAISLLVALISLIPTIGGFISLVPLGLVPLFQGSTVFTGMENATFALLVVGINLVISTVIWNGVAPKIMGDAVALPLPVILIGIVIGAALGGAIGAFLIVPILGTIRVLVEYLMAKVARRDPYPEEPMPEIRELATL